MLFGIRQSAWGYPRRDDGMVVCHLRRVENLFRFLQRLAPERSHQFGVWSLCSEGGLIESVHDGRALRVDVV